MNLAACVILSFGFQAGSINMNLLPSGAFAKIGGYAPIGIKVSDVRPEGVTKVPDLVEPGYGSVEFGGQKFTIAVDRTHLYVDSNANGDLTDDPPTEWTEKSFKSYGLEKKEWDGFATVMLPFNGSKTPCRIGVYELEPSGQMGCYADFCLVGTITLGSETYPAIVSDTSGTFKVGSSTARSAILMIDLDRTGSFNPGYEFFPIDKPFNIHGVTYEVRGSYPDLKVVKSSITVPERLKGAIQPEDPNRDNGLRPGSDAFKFSAKTVSGRDVSFPSSYAGKLVLIDFWATWCGPCMHEVPNVVNAYAKFHTRGLEVLGVSLDQENSLADVKSVTAKMGMNWDQIYEGKFWQGPIVKEYGLKAIPASYLVDGTSGKILAIGDDLRGSRLEATLEKALAAKHPN